jgi:hypothetical protein
MLIAKCYAVTMHLKDGGVVRAPKGAALLHDPTGKFWPKTSCLISTFTRAGKKLDEPKDEERAWAVDPDAVREGSLNTPPRRGAGWVRVGNVISIDYTRKGTHGDQFEHEFKRPVALFRRGRVMRLELGKGAVFNWRGFCNP